MTSETLARQIQDLIARLEQFRFLAEAGALLSTSLDYDARLDLLASLVVPVLADWSVVYEVQDGGVIHRVAAAHHDPQQQALLSHGLKPDPIDPEGSHPVAQALRSGTTLLYRSPANEDTPPAAKSFDDWGSRVDLQARSSMVAPLISRGRGVGALAFHSAQAGRYGETDVALATDLAQRAAVAVENARLYREAQEALRVRNEFLSAVSHDLKTPLTTIKGLAQVHGRRAAASATPESRQFAHGLVAIDEAASRMKALIDELLDLARLQENRPLTLERRPTDLVALVRRVVGVQQRLADRHRIAIETTQPEVTGNWDAALLERAVTHLTSNAIDYSPAGGEVSVTIRCETAADANGVDTAYAVLTVLDHGLGIPSADMPHLFERFYRGRNVRGIAGTGIGLYGTRQIVEQHGGTIAIESTEGEGTTVTVRLPAAGTRRP